MMQITDQQKKMLLIGVGGIALVGGAYLLSKNKSSSTDPQQSQSVNTQSSGNSVVPIPALLAQSAQSSTYANVSGSPTQTPTGNTSNPVPNTSNSLQAFYNMFGLRAYLPTDANYNSNSVANYPAFDPATNLPVAAYVKDKATLLQHYNALKAADYNYYGGAALDARIAQIQAINA